jgi:hypothetical protein
MILPTFIMANNDSLQLTDKNNRSLISYSVNECSWLSLSGTTNVNSFECLSGSGISDNYLLVEVNPQNGRINFTNACIFIETGSFDCKNPLISRDLYKSLGGEQNSTIEIRILDAEPLNKPLDVSTGSIIANVVITINGKSKLKELIINWQRGEGFEYHFQGTTDLTMSDFEIDPPSPALGLIRVNDKITINFNYIVQPGIISRLD